MEIEMKEAEKRKIDFVAMDGEKEAGRISLLAPMHIEGAFVEPDYRGTSTLFKLVCSAEREAANLGATRLFAFAIDEEKADYLQRLGYKKQPWEVWMREL